MNRALTIQDTKNYCNHLQEEEKSAVTIQKYMRDVRVFAAYAGSKPVTKNMTVSYKAKLQQLGYAVRSVNSMLASLNSFLDFLGWTDCKVKTLRLQKQIYSPEERELTKDEYMRLLAAAKGQEQTQLLLQTICGTGIRVSELSYFTVEAVRRGEVYVQCKSKTRTILIPSQLRRQLLSFASKNGVKTGPIFITRSGKPLDRSNIWTRMKRLCDKAGVNQKKVFPHNLRKLFARTFYGVEKDIAKLADILGHGSIDTTRIYLMSTGSEHRKKIEKLGLVMHMKNITT